MSSDAPRDAPMPKLLLASFESSAAVRGAAAHAMAALIAGAPLRLWLGLGDGVAASRALAGGTAVARRPRSAAVGGLSVRVKDMVGAVHELVALALASDTTATACVAVLDCIQALLAVTPYALLTSASDSTPAIALLSKARPQTSGNFKRRSGSTEAVLGPFGEDLLRILRHVTKIFFNDSGSSSGLSANRRGQAGSGGLTETLTGVTGPVRSAAARTLATALSTETPLVVVNAFLMGPRAEANLVDRLINQAGIDLTTSRVEALLLLSRLARVYPACLVSRWDKCLVMLKRCFSSSDANMRLHAIKVLPHSCFGVC